MKNERDSKVRGKHTLMLGGLAALGLALGAGTAPAIEVVVGVTPSPAYIGDFFVNYDFYGTNKTVFLPTIPGGAQSTVLSGLTNNTLLTLGAIPRDAGKRFINWTGNLGALVTPLPTSASGSVLVQAANGPVQQLYGNFGLRQRFLTMLSDGNAQTMTPIEGSTTGYDENTLADIFCTPKAGYEFRFWGDPATPTQHPAISNATAQSTRVLMDKDYSVRAYFSPRYTLTMRDPVGPGSSDIVQNMASGSLYSASVPSVFVPVSVTNRYRCVGWTAGTGNIPGNGGATLYGPFTATQNSSLRWSWLTQYRLLLHTTTGGTTIPEPETDHWYDNNSLVTISASPDEGYVFTGWVGDTNTAGTVQLRMNRAWEVTAQFSKVGADSDNDGLPDAWEIRFGLDYLDPNGANGASGDPDRDGLSNYQEFLIQLTNGLAPYQFANPMNADTDGDGMDDRYERFKIDPAVINPDETNLVSAVLDDGTFNINNGRLGNWDGDSKWSTTDGYNYTNMPLRNYEEWMGPDNIPPLDFVWVNSGDAGYPFSKDQGPVYQARPHAGDTDDQSRGNSTDSDDDGFDDGYEYVWDQWQQANGGSDEVFVIGYHGQTITNTIPAWPANRRFNPNNPHSDPAGPGTDGDVLYDYQTGWVSDQWYTDMTEYNAWQDNTFSPTIADAPHTIRRDLHPDWKRSSHPFLMDVDRDGLPDGWEVTFGYDPWSPITLGHTYPDGADNPDGDWMAYDPANSNNNHEVYLATNFDPRTSWGEFYPTPPQIPGPGSNPTPLTKRYANIDESRGVDGVLRVLPIGVGTNPVDDATNPFKIDSDGDGMWDGWENYVALNPSSPLDGPVDADGDRLLNTEEFQSFVTSSTNRAALTPMTNWMNKIFPTDPTDPDTDGDQVTDGGERDAFNNMVGPFSNRVAAIGVGGIVYSIGSTPAGVWSGVCYPGRGLNPTSADTDNDGLPDTWESTFSGPANGTVKDIWDDPDEDKLLNYQEYWCGAVYHWQWDFWVPGQPSYNPGDFFLGVPKYWDWYTVCNRRPFYYIPFLGWPGYYSTCYPGTRDSDQDGMDDYYEVFHGLNPVYGRIDLVSGRIVGGIVPVPGNTPPHPPPNQVADPRFKPEVIGTPEMDPDGDGIPNDDEAVGKSVGSPAIPTHHTDPTPLWITDRSYPNSWVNLYYAPLETVWYFPIPRPNPFMYFGPSSVFNYDETEGYDSDNDGVADYDEIVGGATSPIDPESPVKRRALALPLGQQAYARTYTGFFFLQPVEALRAFTAEAWVRPAKPASGQRQVVVERPFNVPEGNPMNIAGGVRVNFRIAVDPAGLPYVEYNGSGQQYIFVEARAPGTYALKSNEWTHLAATYTMPTATTHGALKLFVNGNVVATTVSDEIPCIGRFGSAMEIDYTAPLVVGAADNAPDGFVDAFGPQPAPYDYFSGHIDEVRVWNGGLSEGAIQAGMKRAMKRRDAIASFRTNNQMMYLLSFNDQQDPKHGGTAPEGFHTTITAIRPPDWPTVQWWAGANDKSLQYTDWQYVPWFWNEVDHIPSYEFANLGDDPRPTDVGDMRVVTSNVVVNVVSTNATITNVIFSTAFPYPADIYGNYFRSDLAVDWQEEVIPGDLLPLRWAYADEDVPMWDGGGTPSTTSYDTDGDGLPDAWEEQYGLNPLSPDGVNGASGDPDGDGLNNLAEYRAGLNPGSSDTLGNGYGDFFAWSAVGPYPYRIFGELYTDFDGMDDQWEKAYGLDPRSYDANQDADRDGWDNISEFRSGTDPRNPASYPVPAMRFQVRYAGVDQTGNLIIQAYDRASMDAVPDAIYDLTAQPIYTVTGVALGYTGQSSYQGALGAGNIVPGSVYVQYDTYAQGFLDTGAGLLVGTWPGSLGTVNYQTGAYQLTFGTVYNHSLLMYADYQYSNAVPPGLPLDVTLPQPVTGYIRDGDNYFFAFLDRNGNRTWDEGEPAGVAEGQPLAVHWGSAGPIKIGLTDQLKGYRRFAWTAVPGRDEYEVRVVNKSIPGSPLAFDPVKIKAPRAYFHEGDYRLAGATALPAGGYQWFVYTTSPDGVAQAAASNTFTIAYGATQSVPNAIWPVGARYAYAKNEFTWTMDPDAARMRIQIARDAAFADKVLNTVTYAPFREADGTYRFTPPLLAGDGTFTNGVYYWRVAGVNPTVTSAWSPTGSFTVDLTDDPQGPFSVAGDLGYFGKVTNANFIVQAFTSPGFSCTPDAQQTIRNTSSAAQWPLNEFAFKLAGLRPGRYYVRGFLDQNANGVPDPWESSGFIQVLNVFPQTQIVPPSVAGKKLPISLADTDNDKIADDWEYQYFGNLLTAGPGPLRGYTDSNSDGINDYESYAATPMNISPLGVSYGPEGMPLKVKTTFLLDPWTPYEFAILDVRNAAGGGTEVLWPAVTGGSVTGQAGGVASVSKNGVTLQYRLQYSKDLMNWVDVTGAQPVTYDSASDLLRYVDPAGTNRQGFYRCRLSWTY